MFFWKYDLSYSSVWCPALACHCQLDYIPLKIHMLKFYLPVPLIVFLFGDSLYRGCNKISLYRSENNIRVGPNQIGLMSLFSSVQLLSHVSLFATPWTAARHTSLPITNFQSLLKLMSIDRWCHPTISSSVIPFSACLQSFQASGSFSVSQFFTSEGQRIGVSASTSVLPKNTQDWSPLGWTGWISVQSKGLSRVFCNTTVQKHQFFSTQLSL